MTTHWSCCFCGSDWTRALEHEEANLFVCHACGGVAGVYLKPLPSGGAKSRGHHRESHSNVMEFPARQSWRGAEL